MLSSLLFPFLGSSYRDLPGGKLLTGPDHLPIYFLPPPSLRPDTAHPDAAHATPPLILYHHGNGEDLGHAFRHLSQWWERGFAVAAYDYPGYGLSEGRATEASVCRAAEAVLLHLQRQSDHPPASIVHYGRSIGAGPALFLAERHGAAGLILENTFFSAFAVAFPWLRWSPSPFPNGRRLARTRAPALIFHGERDRVVPVRHAEWLKRAGGDTVELVRIAEAGHNDLASVAGERFWKTVESFLSRATVHNL